MDLEITDKKLSDNILSSIKNIASSICDTLSKRTTENKFVIDRFEDNLAVCENIKNKEIIDIPISMLPKYTNQGDVLKITNNNIEVLEKDTTKRKEYIDNLVDNLYK